MNFNNGEGKKTDKKYCMINLKQYSIHFKGIMLVMERQGERQRGRAERRE